MKRDESGRDEYECCKFDAMTKSCIEQNMHRKDIKKNETDDVMMKEKVEKSGKKDILGYAFFYDDISVARFLD